MEKQEDYDFLLFKTDKNINKFLQKGETILVSAAVFKFNEVNKRQNRNLLITNQNIYNLDKKSATRKTLLQKVYAITLSTISSEFVIHIPDEYDYRYSSFENREQIVQMILYVRGTLPIFFKKEVQLTQITTTKIDIKKGISHQQTLGEKIFNTQQWKTFIIAENQERNEIRSKTHTVVSKKGDKVTREDFNTLKLLGRGGFGKVFLVEKKDTLDLFAMKELKIVDDKKQQNQYMNMMTEKLILENVDHPFVVGLQWIIQTPIKLYFIIPFMKGGELYYYMKQQKKISESFAKFYIAELTLGLEYLHSKHVIYRDLKLENILLDEKGHIKITDFGLSKILVMNQDSTNTFCGTPSYVAPEILKVKLQLQIKKQLNYSYQVDWWSLGVCLFIFLFGVPPFYSKNNGVMFKQIKEMELQIPQNPSISNEAKDLIKTLLQKDPSQRLGATGDGEQIKNHPWFNGINWARCIKKELTPPYIPKTNDEQYLNNFDKLFTDEKIEHTVLNVSNNDENI